MKIMLMASVDYSGKISSPGILGYSKDGLVLVLRRGILQKYKILRVSQSQLVRILRSVLTSTIGFCLKVQLLSFLKIYPGQSLKVLKSKYCTSFS